MWTLSPYWANVLLLGNRQRRAVKAAAAAEEEYFIKMCILIIDKVWAIFLAWRKRSRFSVADSNKEARCSWLEFISCRFPTIISDADQLW